MQKQIDMTAVLCNKISQHLVVQQYFEAQQTIKKHGIFLYGSQVIDVKTDGRSQRSIHKDKSASEVALEMTDLAIKISEDYALRSKLTYQSKLQSHLSQSLLSDSGSQPFGELENIDPSSEIGKNKIKTILLAYHETHPSQVKSLRLKFGISQSQWNEWLMSAEKCHRHSCIKQKVQEKTPNGVKITLSEFKKIARQVYGNQHFRPSEVWSRRFVEREGLLGRIKVPSQK